MSDLDRDRELRPADRRRGVLLSAVVAIIGAAIIIGLLFRYTPWNNVTASDSANSNAGAVQGLGAGAQSGPSPTMPGQAIPTGVAAPR